MAKLVRSGNQEKKEIVPAWKDPNAGMSSLIE